MHRLDNKTRNFIINNLKEDLSGPNKELIVGEIEIFQDSQPDVIDSTVIRAVQDHKPSDTIRVLDVEYDNTNNSISLYYLDVEKSSLKAANEHYKIGEDNKYSLLFELQLESIYDFCEKGTLDFFHDSVLKVEEIIGLYKEV